MQRVTAGWDRAVASGKPAQIAAARDAAKPLSQACPALQRRITIYYKAETDRRAAKKKEEAKRREAAQAMAEREHKRKREAQDEITRRNAELLEIERKRKAQADIARRNIESSTEIEEHNHRHGVFEQTMESGMQNSQNIATPSYNIETESPTNESAASSVLGGSTVTLSPSYAALEESCLSGIGTDCLMLGYAFLNKTAVRTSNQYSDAAEFFALACKNNDAEGCNNWGVSFATGQGENYDENRAFLLYRQSCEMGYFLACLNQGVLFEHGRGVSVDYAAAADLYEKACKGGFAAACTKWGLSFVTGYGEQRNYKRAVELFDKACKELDAEGCFSKGLALVNGDGVRQNFATAADYFEKSCGLGSLSGCLSWGVSFESGKGRKEDLTRARAIYENICDNNYAVGCLYAARSYLIDLPSSHTSIRHFVEKGIALEPDNAQILDLKAQIE